MQEWSVYMLRCGDGSLYTGIATNVQRRIGEHARGKRGAKYLRGRGPLQLVFTKVVGDRGIAQKIECRVRKLPKRDKEDLRQLPARIDELLTRYRDSGQ